MAGTSSKTNGPERLFAYTAAPAMRTIADRIAMRRLGRRKNESPPPDGGRALEAGLEIDLHAEPRDAGCQQSGDVVGGARVLALGLRQHHVVVHDVEQI